MSSDDLYSIRMRAAREGRHVSGAERIIEGPAAPSTAGTLIERAFGRDPTPDTITVTVDLVRPDQIQRIRALDIVLSDAADVATCRDRARVELERAGVSAVAIDAALAALDHGPSSSGGTMRGAMVMDAATGERLEPDRERGIRASRFDWSSEAAREIDVLLNSAGLTHFRTREALALASKAAHAPGMVAELCWSDEPDYMAGYVATRAYGYLRLPHMKRAGTATGGRAFFIDRSTWDQVSFRCYLQEVPVLISGRGSLRGSREEVRSSAPAGRDLFAPELARLEQDQQLRTLRSVGSAQGPVIVLQGRTVLQFASNDYLGLAGHADLVKAADAAMNRYGFGSGASRLISGNSELHEELEAAIASFKDTESALLFNSGYAANTAVIPALAGEGDAVFSDALNHASIVDGCRLSRARTRVYRHRDLDHLEQLLQEGADARRRLIVTDGVFSMDGDIAPLPGLVELAERHGALLMVDDAHATGVLGSRGRGTAEHFGLQGRVPIQMGTLSKALGSLGGFVAGERRLIAWLLNTCRGYIFSTALPPAVCAASMAALGLVDREPWRRERLWRNRERLADGLRSLGLDDAGSETPVIPIVIGSAQAALDAASRLLDQDIYAPAVRPPSVPAGTSRIRTTVMATHEESQIDRLLSALRQLQQEGILSGGTH